MTYFYFYNLRGSITNCVRNLKNKLFKKKLNGEKLLFVWKSNTKILFWKGLLEGLNLQIFKREIFIQLGLSAVVVVDYFWQSKKKSKSIIHQLLGEALKQNTVIFPRPTL